MILRIVMKLLTNSVALVVILLLFSCQNEYTVPESKENDSKQKNEVVTATSKGSDNNILSITQNPSQKVYELKEDGLYIYSDSWPKIEKSIVGCFKVIQKNYKYLRVPIRSDLLAVEEGPKTYQLCNIVYNCENDYGKPSLKELGYERHKEREIKPEDNRFGIQKIEPKKIVKPEKRLKCETEYLTLPKSAFMELSIKEFVENGIVIIGKHVSRVEIKSLEHLPKWIDRVAVQQTTKCYDCTGKTTENVINPKVIADFKKIHFKENIFEFIVEEPIPDNSAYLSDEEYMKLTNDLHQLIPRIYDRTIHNVAKYKADYYIIEYYNGDVLSDYLCIKLSNKGPEPKLWDKLVTQPPTESKSIISSKEKCYLIIAEFSSTDDVKEFILRKPVGEALIYHLNNGKSVLAVEFESTKKAESEMNRYINMGFKKENLRIEKF